MEEIYVLIDGQENDIIGTFDDLSWLFKVYCNSLRENGDDEVLDFCEDVKKYGLNKAIEQRGQYIKTFSINPETIF